jgi:hypothetical protein
MSIPGAPTVARIPPDPALLPHQRNWHERLPCQDYVELAADLSEWALGIPADEAELVITEIVTNAVTAQAIRWPASRPPVRLWLRGGTGLLFILVWDGVPQVPQPAIPGIGDEAGRGLLLVDAFSRWGYYRPAGDNSGKVVWSQLPKPEIQ